jgi:hypothetical protein
MGLATGRGHEEAVAAQVGRVDLAANEPRGLRSLQVYLHGGLRHREAEGELGGVGMLVDLGEDEELLHLHPQRVHVRRDGRDDRREQPVTQRPTLGFPQSMQPWFAGIHNGGTTVNGMHAPPSPFVMEKGGEPY